MDLFYTRLLNFFDAATLIATYLSVGVLSIMFVLTLFESFTKIGRKMKEMEDAKSGLYGLERYYPFKCWLIVLAISLTWLFSKYVR